MPFRNALSVWYWSAMAAFSRSGVRAPEIELGLGFGGVLAGWQANHLGDVDFGGVEPDQIGSLLGLRRYGRGQGKHQPGEGEGVCEGASAHHVHYYGGQNRPTMKPVLSSHVILA